MVSISSAEGRARNGDGDPAPSNEETEEATAFLSEVSEAKEKLTRTAIEGYIIYEKHLSDIEITPEPTNPVMRNSDEPATRLKAIGGHPAQILKNRDLRMFCVRNHIRGGRRANKFQLCYAIAQARVKYDDGEPLPYMNCFPRDVKDQPAADVDVVDLVDDGVNTKSKKRARKDFEEAVDIELGGDTSIHFNITDRVEQSKLVTMQSRIAQSVEVKNTIESASVIRREIREERNRRDTLWEKLVAQIGDEVVASSKYFAYRKAKQMNETDVEADDEGFVMRSREQLLEDIYEEDILIQQLKKQHAKLTEAVSKLVA